MTLPSDKDIEMSEPFFLTPEEKESTLQKIFAVIDSADPPAWAGLPLPKKLSWYKRLWEYLSELLF